MLVILWNLKSPSVEIHRCGCERDCQMGNRLRLPFTVSWPGQQPQFDEAMTKELSQVLAADAVRLTQEEELNLKPERLLRMRWVLTWKKHRRWRQKCKSAVGHFWISPPRTHKRTDSSTNTWKYVTSFVTAGIRPAQTSGPFG